MVKPLINSLPGKIALPFKCAELQPITVRQDMELSQHMSMVYNPASTNACESHEWSDAPVTYKDVDWNVFVLETRIDDHLQNNDLLINNAKTSQTQGTNRQQTNEILNTNEGEVIDLPDYTDEYLESRWMKSDLSMDYDGDEDNNRDK